MTVGSIVRFHNENHGLCFSLCCCGVFFFLSRCLPEDSGHVWTSGHRHQQRRHQQREELGENHRGQPGETKTTARISDTQTCTGTAGTSPLWPSLSLQTSVINGTYLALEHMSREHGKDGGIIINVSSMAGESMFRGKKAVFHAGFWAALHHLFWSKFQLSFTLLISPSTRPPNTGWSASPEPWRWVPQLCRGAPYTHTPAHPGPPLCLLLQDASSEGNYGVRINVVCPAFVNTPLLRSVEDEDNMGKLVKFKDDFKSRMDKFGVLE